MPNAYAQAINVAQTDFDGDGRQDLVVGFDRALEIQGEGWQTGVVGFSQGADGQFAKAGFYDTATDGPGASEAGMFSGYLAAGEFRGAFDQTMLGWFGEPGTITPLASLGNGIGSIELSTQLQTEVLRLMSIPDPTQRPAGHRRPNRIHLVGFISRCRAIVLQEPLVFPATLSHELAAVTFSAAFFFDIDRDGDLIRRARLRREGFAIHANLGRIILRRQFSCLKRSIYAAEIPFLQAGAATAVLTDSLVPDSVPSIQVLPRRGRKPWWCLRDHAGRAAELFHAVGVTVSDTQRDSRRVSHRMGAADRWARADGARRGLGGGACSRRARHGALEYWPASGVPDNPGAWLMATAKRRAIDELQGGNKRWQKKQDAVGHEIETRAEFAAPDLDAALDDDVGDDLSAPRVHLLPPVFASTESRVALTLRLLGGLTTTEIARAFLTPETTIAQRIVRAKKQLSDSGVPFEVPRGAELAARLSSVLEVVYLIFNEGYSATAGEDWMRPRRARTPCASVAFDHRLRRTSQRCTD